MESIEININNITKDINIYIDVKHNQIIINNQRKEITNEQIDELIRIIRTWDSNYPKTNNTIDSEKFLIKINTNEGTYTTKGEGTYPKNYITFKDWIDKFYE